MDYFFFFVFVCTRNLSKGNLYLFPWRYIVVSFVASRGDEPDEKYPLVLFLHGAGERGNDNEKQFGSWWADVA